MRCKIFYIILFATCVANVFAGNTHAPDLQDTLQELTVVNQRIAAVQESAVAAQSAVYMRQLEQEQRTTYKDLSGLIPNMYVPDYGSRMTSSIYIRGLGARIDNPVLGVYIDGVGIANKNSYDFDLFDIRRVQIARGPQGTLTGRNTIGGVMMVSTISPLDWQGTRATIGYGNFNNIDAKVSHYALLKNRQTATYNESTSSDSQFGLGVAAYYRHHDGFFTNEYDGKAVDASHEAGARLRIDGKNNRGYKNSTFLSYNFVQQGGFPYHQPGKGINHNDTCAYTRHNLTFGSSYTFPVGDYLLSGSTSYQYLNDHMQMDQDYQPLSYFTLHQKQQEHYVSQELTLKPKNKYVIKDNSLWDWLTGMQVTYKHNSMFAPVHFFQTGIDSLIIKNANNGIHTAYPDNVNLVLMEDNFVIGSEFETQSTDVAAYHTSFLNFGNWKLELGLRLDFEYQHFRYASEGLIHYLVENTAITDFRECHTLLKGTTSIPYFEALPKIAVSYGDNSNRYPGSCWRVYASVSEGYKAGGFNTQLFSDILQNTMMEQMMDDMGVHFAYNEDYTVSEVITYRPERCLSFATGAEGRWKKEDVQLTGNIDLFELEVFNQQLTTFPKHGTGRLMTNAGRSRSMGGELTAGLSWKGLSFRAAYGYTYAFFTRYDDGKQDYSGKRVPYVPENTLFASAEYRFVFNHKFFHSLTLNINTNAFGRIFWDENNTYSQPFYALLNANIALQMKYITLELWGKNLTQTNYDVFRFVSMGNTFMQSGKPLTLGGKIKIEI